MAFCYRKIGFSCGFSNQLWEKKHQQVGALDGFVLADTPVQQSPLEYLHFNVSPHLWYHGPAEPNKSQTLWQF